LSARWARPVDHLGLPHVLDKSSLAERVYRLSDGGSPPGVCAGRGWGHGAPHDLHCAYLGEEVQPTLRKVKREA
jgi:hypothetical protein